MVEPTGRKRLEILARGRQYAEAHLGDMTIGDDIFLTSEYNDEILEESAKRNLSLDAFKTVRQWLESPQTMSDDLIGIMRMIFDACTMDTGGSKNILVPNGSPAETAVLLWGLKTFSDAVRAVKATQPNIPFGSETLLNVLRAYRDMRPDMQKGLRDLTAAYDALADECRVLELWADIQSPDVQHVTTGSDADPASGDDADGSVVTEHPLGLQLDPVKRTLSRRGSDYNGFLVQLGGKQDQWDLVEFLLKHGSITKSRYENLKGLRPDAAKKLRQRTNDSISSLNVEITEKPWALVDKPA